MASDKDEAARRERAEQLRKRVDELRTPASGGPADQQPDESDLEYVERRMRELDRKNDR